MSGHLETFLARQRERDRPVPRFVERELRKFLECGVAAGGFLRVHCDGCGMDRVVPYSCKCRGFCPSCCGRRMADTAAHLVDRVFPEEPIRQWLLSVPHALRYRLAYDASLVTAVARIFQRAVFASIRRRAGMRSLNRRARSGAVLFIQRFSDALNLDPHFLDLFGLLYRGSPFEYLGRISFADPIGSINIRNVDKAPWTCPVRVGLLFSAPWAGSLERRVHGNPIGCSQDAYPAVSGPGGNAAKGNF